MRQIWQDTDFTLAGTERPVRITVDGGEIYRGVLSALPNEEDVSTRINRLCEPFLGIDYPENTGVTRHPEAYRVFTVEDWDGNLLGTQDFIYDWSYEDFRPVLSRPVNGKLDPRMRLPYTMWRTEAGNVEIEITEGSHWIDPDTCSSECFVDYCADCQQDYCASDFDPEPEPVTHIYTNEIQLLGNNRYSDSTLDIYSSSALTFGVSGDYFTVTRSGSTRSRFNLLNRSNPAPTGSTGTISITKDGEEFAEIGYRVTSWSASGDSFFMDSANSISAEEMTFTFTDTPIGDVSYVVAHPEGYGNNFTITSAITLYDYYNVAFVRFLTLLTDDAYVDYGPNCLIKGGNRRTDNENGVLTIRKSAKTNAIFIGTNGDFRETTYSVSLASGYVSIVVYNPIMNGLTDIYLDDTTRWFNSLPDLEQGSGNQNSITKRGKYLASINPVTVHCKDGDITWIPNGRR